MNSRLKIYLTISIGLGTLTLLSGCVAGGSGYYGTGYYGGSGWHDPYYYQRRGYGGVVVAPPPRYRTPHGSRPGRPGNLPSGARPRGGGRRR
jgi:hypothetical protein